MKAGEPLNRNNGANVPQLLHEIQELGLPTDKTVSFAEFIVGIANKNAVNEFGRRKNARGTLIWQAEFRTMNYRMTDYIEEMRNVRDNPEKSKPAFSAYKIFDHAAFPPPPKDQTTAVFDMAKMQELVSRHAEELRVKAAELHGAAQVAQVETWIRERAAAMEVENMYRRSDGTVYKKKYLEKRFTFDVMPGKPFKVITRPERVVFPDGTYPAPDPRNGPNPKKLGEMKYKDLESWDGIDTDRTLSQGDKSIPAKLARKKALGVFNQYETATGILTPEERKTTRAHLEIIRANEFSIPFHRGPRGEMSKCEYGPIKPRRISTPFLRSANESTAGKVLGNQLDMDDSFAW